MQILALAKARGFVFCLIDFMLIAAVSETVIRTEKHKKIRISAPFIECCRCIALAQLVEGAFSFRERETRSYTLLHAVFKKFRQTLKNLIETSIN